MSLSLRALCPACAALSVAALHPLHARAQTAPEPLPVLVITATRTPMDASRLGSAISVVSSEEIAAWGSKSIADVLRNVPGLDVTENGGPGTLSTISLRGASAGQSLVMIDGIRAGDPSSTSGEADLGNITADNIERIEVLRGPQSALYGSDAMGGVVNIVTRKGVRDPKTTFTMEGGSYGTVSTRLAHAGATGRVSWAFSLGGFHSDGFSRYGYRIGRIEAMSPFRLENDSAGRISGSARVSYKVSDNVDVDVGLRRVHATAQLDNPGAFVPAMRDTRYNKGRQTFTQVFGRINASLLDGRLNNSLTIFANWIDRLNRIEQGCFDAFFNIYDCNYVFRSRRAGAEYQGDMNFGRAGKTIFGARAEHEQAVNEENWLAPVALDLTRFNAHQQTNSVFLMHQLPLGPLSLSLGGRVDTVDNRQTFPTWRATAAYMIEQTGTKLRASVGTGAKAASLFQRFSQYGTPNLQPEQNTGYDVGVDQTFAGGRVKASVTAFDSRYRNLIDFDFLGNNGLGAYINVGHARMRGVEASASAILVPEIWRARATYTRLQAVDTATNLALLRRPRDKASLSLTYTGIAQLEVEGRITYVGKRIDIQNDFPYSRAVMAPYGRFDMRAAYKVNDSLSIFARAENITNAHYQEIRDYGTTGRAFYAGATVTW